MTIDEINAVLTHDTGGFSVGECIGCGDLTTARLIIKTFPDQDDVERPLCRPCKEEL